MMRTPDFEVDAKSFGPSVHWEDADRRYHFWLDDAGNPRGDTLHSNLKVRPKKFGDHGHSKMSLSAKRWAPVVSAIIEKIKADDLVAKARARAEYQERAQEADRIKKLNDDALACLDRAATVLPDEASNMIRGLPEHMRLRFVNMIQSSR